MNRYIKQKWIAGLVLVLCAVGVYASGNKHIAQDTIQTEEKLDAGELIIGHVLDAHDWHILSVGDHHLSIPLPIILYYQGRLDVFSSARLAHGHAAYRGYRLQTQGPDKGKIIRVLADGQTPDPEADLPLDFSITKNVLAVFISVFLMCWLFISVGRNYKRHPDSAPKGLQSWVEPLIIFVRDDIAIPSIGPKKYERYMPFLLTIFFFILLNNLLGLVPFFPGGANVTGNIAVTLVLALFTFVITTVSGNRNYWKHIFNAPGVPWWLKFPFPLMPIVELLGVFTKPFVLMVRLFANIMAGHIIGLSFVSLIFIFGALSAVAGYGVSVVSLAFMIFMNLLELLVAFIQAYVFTILSAIYFGMATEEAH